MNEPRTNEAAYQAGYAAVWAGNCLTRDAWENARIWRSVETALTAALEVPND